MRKLLYVMLALLLVCQAGLAEGMAVTDGMGRDVVFDSAPQTCVSLTPANTEILFALGLSGRVLGVDNQSDYPGEAAALGCKLGDYYAPNVEAIVALQPDVVFASDKLQQDAIDQLGALGLKVVCNDPTSFEGVAPGIELIAQVMGADAAPLTAAIQGAVDAVRNGAPAGPVKVYFALSFGEYGDYTAGPGTFIDDMIALSGGVNVAGGMPVSWPQYSIEQLVTDDPDVILVSDYAGDGSIERQLMATPGYDSLRAVAEGRVYGVDANITSRPGPRIGEALRLFSAALTAQGEVEPAA